MDYKVKVTQVLRVETSTVLVVEADSLDDAIAAIASGAIDLPAASDDFDTVWVVDRSSLENEDYSSA